MFCPHCKNDLKPPPDFWQDRVAPWSCSYCGGLYGISNNFKPFAILKDFRPLAPLLSQSIANRWCYYSHPCNYVYALCYPTGIPFYVGVGVGRRAVAHRLDVLKKTDRLETEKENEINRLESTGLGVWYHFLALTKDRREALTAEAFWIHYWELRSRGGMLTNDCYPPSPPELTDEESPPVPDEIMLPDDDIRTFSHPDIAVCPSESSHREGNEVSIANIVCNACGTSVRTDKSMTGKHIICCHCGHYVYGMDFRERFPLKQFADREFMWAYRRKNC